MTKPGYSSGVPTKMDDTMASSDPERPLRYRLDEDWLHVTAPPAGERRPLDADLLDEGGPDEPDAPEPYWTLRRVIWVIMALLALVALLASVIAPLIQPRPALPQPPPDMRDLAGLLGVFLA
jgi:hypothetical protein